MGAESRDAAAYLIRTARPNASEAEVARATASVIADPNYRDELALDATTRLTDDVNRAMAILLRNDRRLASLDAEVQREGDDG